MSNRNDDSILDFIQPRKCKCGKKGVHPWTPNCDQAKEEAEDNPVFQLPFSDLPRRKKPTQNDDLEA